MRPIDLETWVQRVADEVRAGRPDEDTRVELKAEWPDDPQRAARRLAGQANAAGGQPVLWIIGLDRARGALGAPYAELAGWWNAVRARFDEIEPSMLLSVNVPYEGVTLVALLFDTERAPYVLTLSPPAGAVQREVPWREGTGTRSARRQDILRMLAPLRVQPQVEVTECEVVAKTASQIPQPINVDWSLTWIMFIVPPRSEAFVTVAGHRSRLTLGYDDGGALLMDRELRFPSQDGSPFGRQIVHFGEPQFARLSHGVATSADELRSDALLIVTIFLVFASDDRAVILRERLVPVARDPNEPQLLGHWRRAIVDPPNR